MNRILSIAAAVVLISACSFNDGEFVEIHELGCQVVKDPEDADFKEVVPAEGGHQKFRIYSNGKVSIKPVGGLPQWARIDKTEIENDDVVTVALDANPGFERKVEFVAVLDGGAKELSFVVKQSGSAYIFCATPYRTVKGSTSDEASFDIETNITDDRLVISWSDGWISDARIGEGQIVVSTIASSESLPRKALLNVNLEGAADSCAVSLFLTQKSASDQMGQEISFADLRSLASADGTALEEFTLLKGVVISDYTSSNMEQNPVLPLDQAGSMTNLHQTSGVRADVQQVVDTTASLRTAYVQAEDGSYGFRLVFEDHMDNILAFGSAVTIDLGGTVLTREENPERYTISSLAGANILESAAGRVVVKEKRISELTDADIYTFVGIRNVEFPVKEGSYADVRDNNALYSEVNANTTSKTSQHYFFMDGYATTLVDDAGDVICCPINMLCRWRRPSAGIPQGSGTAKGIITYNDIKRYGNAGRYQLRVVDENGFEDLTGASNWTEHSCWEKGKTEATRGQATLTCEKPGASLTDEHSYKSRISATSKTCGISDSYRSLRVTSSIKDWYRWDGEQVAGYNGMLFKLSTENISGNTMLFSFRFYAGRVGDAITYQAFPSHWCVEYSVDGQNWEYAENGDLSGNGYVHLKAISTMHFLLNGFTYRPSVYYSLGPTGHSFRLPSEVFGKEEVQIRLRPYDNVMSSLYPYSFTDDLEHAKVTSATEVTDYISFQDIIISYR